MEKPSSGRVVTAKRPNHVWHADLAVMPMRIAKMIAELEFYVAWFNEERPHEALGGRTPNEACPPEPWRRRVYHRRVAANTQPRLEPRPKWPRKSKCAAPQAKIRGPCGVRIELVLQFQANRKHLPIVRLNTPA